MPPKKNVADISKHLYSIFVPFTSEIYDVGRCLTNRLANKSSADQLLSSFPASKLHCEGGASEKLPAFASTYDVGKAVKLRSEWCWIWALLRNLVSHLFVPQFRLQSVASVSLQVLIVYLSQVNPSTYTAFLLSSFYIFHHETFHL